MKDNIILIGYMGSGKTSLGKKLSYKERIALLDTDRMIEQKQGMTVSEIFEKKGEGAFRIMETECLKEILGYSEKYVISVGGGLPIKEENRELLKELGTVVYLRAKPDTIYARLKNDTSRPLLRGDDPRGKIEDMIGKRGPVYELAADCIIDVDEKGCEVIIGEILEALKHDLRAK